jgi:flagellar hook assembly protein FlgD
VTATDPASHARESRDRFTFVTSSSTDVAVSEIPPAAVAVMLYANRPNPVQSSTLIPFDISTTAPAGMTRVSLRIFDAGGRLVRTLVSNEEHAVPGTCLERWDGKDEKGRRVSSGIYYYRLTAAGKDLSRRMVVLR